MARRSFCRPLVAVAGVALAAATVVMPPVRGAAASGTKLPVSFECTFTEPFLSFTIAANGAWLNEEAQSIALRSASARVSASKVTLTATRADDASRVTLAIVHRPGDDGMSSYTSEWSATYATYSGRCDRYPNGSVAMGVTGVADNDVLNIRAKPSASAAIVTKVQPEGTVFSLGARSGSWVKVAAADYPAGGEGNVVVKQGWAKESFLRTLT